MDYDKLIHCLKCCARVDAQNVGCDDCGLEYCGEECQQLCGTAATAIETLRADLARVTAERDAIERDFRAFTKQWWEEANGFPCRFCKFEKSGGCEQKGKHPDDEKPCAGRWFEWRDIKED